MKILFHFPVLRFSRYRVPAHRQVEDPDLNQDRAKQLGQRAATTSQHARAIHRHRHDDA